MSAQVALAKNSSLKKDAGFDRRAVLNNIPQYFEQNRGQHEREFNFVAQTPYSQFAFAKDRIIIQLKKQKGNDSQQFSLVFKNTEENVIITGQHPSHYKVNYLRGAQSQWRENINTFSEIFYHNIYPGIDLRLYFNASRLEYDFIVAAGVDPSIISFSYENIGDVKITKNNALAMSINGGAIQQHAPIIYQYSDTSVKHENNKSDEKIIVAGQYIKTGNDFSFLLSDYDKSKILIIDPIIEFSAYFGGDWEDNATTVATDSQGNIFLAGATSARARITVNNIMTLDNRSLVTKEGNNTDSYDAVHGLSLGTEFLTTGGTQTLDLISNEKIDVVTGMTDSYEYPCDYRYSGFFSRDTTVTDYDAFLSKFDSNYVEIFTTYYGGCRNDGIRTLVIDANDDVYVAGFTLSEDLPKKSPSQIALGISRFPSEPRQSDAFYAKFDNDGELIYSSYLGGNGRDGARAIAVDDEGYLYITGYTHSSDLTSCSIAETNVVACESIGGIELINNVDGVDETSLYSDAFVAKVSPAGNALSFITYFGGSFDDWGQAIALYDDAIYISGNTSSPDLPAPSSGYSFFDYHVNNEKCSRVSDPTNTIKNVSQVGAHICEDVYLAKISKDGLDVLFTTYLGGKNDDNVSDMEIDSEGNIYLVGTTRSQGVRITRDGFPGDNESDFTKSTFKTLIRDEFPLYKQVKEFRASLDATTAAFLTVFKAKNVVETQTVTLHGEAERFLFSTFIGGSNTNSGIGVELGALNGNNLDVYVAGHTLSSDFYTQSAFQNWANNSELFITKLVLNRNNENLYNLPASLLNTNCYYLDDEQIDDLRVSIKRGDNVPDEVRNLFDANGNLVVLYPGCDLYNFSYSTLLGGEGLDALKNLYYSAFDNSVYLVGTTYSTLFPVTLSQFSSTSNFKETINEVLIKDYHPRTRAVEFEESYFPSDMFLTKLTDFDEIASMTLNVTVSNTNVIYAGDQIVYDVSIENHGAIDAQSIRISLSFPYLASNETISSYASITGAKTCVMEYKQIYCFIGNLEANKSVSLNIVLTPRVSGEFPVTFSLMSQTQINNLPVANKENGLIKVSRVRIVPSRGAIALWSVGVLSLFFVAARFFRRRIYGD